MRTPNKSRTLGKHQIELQTLRKEHQDQNNNTMKALGLEQKHHENTKYIESTIRTPRLD
jgi:hypothetical protein